VTDAAEKWGWGHSEKMLHGDFKLWGIDQTLRDLGSSDKCWGWGGSVDCLTFVHGYKYNEDGNFVVDGSTYNVDGRTYRRSGAHYGIGFEPQKGSQ
jgi:hypothetical protein